MSKPRERSMTELSEWLEIATKDLSMPAKERIALEISGHYAEALEEHRSTGLSEVGARLVALKELGDPKVAARSFRRRHLTEKEAKRIETTVKQARQIWQLVFYFVLIGFGVWMFKRHPNSNPGPTFSVVGCLFFFMAGRVGLFILARNTGTHQPVRWIILLDMVVLLLMVCGLGACLHRTDPHWYYVFWWTVPWSYRQLSLLLKLYKTGNSAFESPAGVAGT